MFNFIQLLIREGQALTHACWTLNYPFETSCFSPHEKHSRFSYKWAPGQTDYIFILHSWLGQNCSPLPVHHTFDLASGINHRIHSFFRLHPFLAWPMQLLIYVDSTIPSILKHPFKKTVLQLESCYLIS